VVKVDECSIWFNSSIVIFLCVPMVQIHHTFTKIIIGGLFILGPRCNIVAVVKSGMARISPISLFDLITLDLDLHSAHTHMDMLKIVDY